MELKTVALGGAIDESHSFSFHARSSMKCPMIFKKEEDL